MKLSSLALLSGIVIPPWFLEALGGVGTCVAYVFGRMSKQDVSDSKLAGVIDTVTKMGDGVKVMAEASAARQSQIEGLQTGLSAAWAEIGRLRDQNARQASDLSYLRGQVGK